MYGSLEQGRGTKITQAANFSQAASGGTLQLIGLLVAQSTSWVISIYDGIDDTGALLVDSMPVVAGTPYPLPVILNTGLFIKTVSGSGSGCVIWGR